MSRHWEPSYESLGDVSDCLREGIKMMRKTVPTCKQGPIRHPGAPVDVGADLEQRLADMVALLKRFEEDRTHFFMSHNETPAAKPKSSFPFVGILPATDTV